MSRKTKGRPRVPLLFMLILLVQFQTTPHIERTDGAVWIPEISDPVDRFFVLEVLDTVVSGQAVTETQVTDGKDVRPPHSEDKVHMRGPGAYAFYLR